MNPYIQLIKRFQKLNHLEHALTFLQWDYQVMMPQGGSEPRSQAIAELTTLHHKLLASSETGDLLKEAAGQVMEQGGMRNLQEMQREYQRAICLPTNLVKAQSLAGSKCEHGWRSQRKNNDWHGFLKNFREVVKLAREEAEARRDCSPGMYPTPYDAMLDLYCTGDSSSFISSVLTTLKKELPDLVLQIVEKQSGDCIPNLQGFYPTELQQKLNRELMKWLGFDFDRGRLDVSAHPFSTGCRGDHRITNRFRQTDFLDSLMATAHETGHASYESGLPEKWDGLPIGRARNLCIHESQSLLFEKQLFLSLPFITFFTGKIHSYLPGTDDFSSSRIWSAATRVQPSYIRTEADEVTYPLHIILRYEIERGLINGSLKVEDVPATWDAKMQKYLGISTIGNNTEGCLQDIHWTNGSFGYFPSYTIGALNAAQLFAAIQKSNPGWQQKLASGDVSFVRSWLEQAIWNKGSTKDSQEIIFAATGENTNPDFFINHIRKRYMEELY